jgi:purine-binding chemotaxis protein CheW
LEEENAMSEVELAEGAESEDVEQDQYLVFTCASQEFAIRGVRVQEISAPLALTRIPGTPGHFEGIANLRGRLVSVIDFRTKFGFEPRTQDEDTRVILAEYEGYPIGLTVDSVEEVIRIPDETVHELPEALGAPLSPEFITGMGLLDGRMIILLDLDKVLAGSAAPPSALPPSKPLEETSRPAANARLRLQSLQAPPVPLAPGQPVMPSHPPRREHAPAPATPDQG